MKNDAREPIQPEASDVELDPLLPTTPSGVPLVESMMPLLGSVKVRVTVLVGVAHMSLAELLEMRQGSVLTLDRDADAPLDVLIEDRVVARGVLVAVGEHFGLRITEAAHPTTAGAAAG